MSATAPADAASPTWRRAIGPFTIVIAVLAANFPFLVGLTQLNPIGTTDVTDLSVRHGFLPGIPYLDPSIGWIFQPLAHLAAMDWLHGIVPWWNPYEGLGAPLAAGMQSAAMFPPILLLALPNGLVWFHICLELIAGFATWLLVRELGLGRGVATLGGVLFALNGTLAWFAHAPIDPVPFLPLTLLGLERLARRESFDVPGWLALAFGISLSIYAGFPETTYLDGLLVVAWFVFRFVRRRSGTRTRFATRVASSTLVGILLSAPLLVAFVQNLPIADIGRHAGGIAVQKFVPGAVQMVGLPYVYGPVAAFNSVRVPALRYFWGSASGGYLTPTLIVLAVVGVLGGRSHPGLRWLLGVFAACALGWQLAIPPFASIFQRIVPFAHEVNAFRYFSPAWEMAVVLLACFGTDAVAKGWTGLRLASIVGGVGTLALLGIEMALAWATIEKIRSNSSSYGVWPVISIVWGAAIVVAVTALAIVASRRTGYDAAGRAARRRRRTRLAGGIGVLLCLDAMVMFTLPELSAPRSVTVDAGPTKFLRAHLGEGRFFSMWVFHAEVGSYLDLSSINSNTMPVPDMWATYLRRHLASDANPLIFDGQRFYSPGPNPVTELHRRLESYEAVDVEYVLVQRHHRVFGRLKHGKYSGGARLVYRDSHYAIYALPHPKPFFRTTAAPASAASCVLHSSGISSVVARCPRAETLVRSELDLPGWSATVNGRSVPIIGVGGGLQGVALPAGTDDVEFSYFPPGESSGIVLFVLGILAVLAVAFRRRVGVWCRQLSGLAERYVLPERSGGRASTKPGETTPAGERITLRR